MPVMEFGGEQLEVDGFGHLIYPEKWSAGVATRLAKEDGKKMNIPQFQECCFLRNECIEFDPTTGKEVVVKNFYERVPCLKFSKNFSILHKEDFCSWKYAGLPRPS
jgi:sulfur relay (sulfurtransferase) DsrC/TusE family protein